LTEAGIFYKIQKVKTFITGGTGFIGSHLIDYLVNTNTEIYALTRNINKLKWLEGLKIHFLEGNLLSIPSLPSDIDTIFHIAGLTKTNKSADYYTVNQQGTASLFQALLSQKIFPKKIICLSSIAASGPSCKGKPVNEYSFPDPVTPYGKSKLLGETEALKFKDKFHIVIIRVGAVFGPRDKDFLSYFKIINRGILPSVALKPRLLSFCYVKDLIKALYLCTQKNLESGEIINIADPTPYTWDEFGQAAGNALGKTLRKIKIPLSAIYPFALASDLASKVSRNPSILDRYKFREMKQYGWVTDTKKASEKLSFRPQYSLQEAVQETVDWYIKQGWL